MLLSSLKDFLLNFRNNGFDETLQESKNFATKHDINTEFQAERIRRKTRFFDEKATDAPIKNPIDKLRVELFNYIIDTALQSVTSRYESLDAITLRFDLVLHLNIAHSLSINELKVKCSSISDSLDIDPVALQSEISFISKKLQTEEISSPIDVLNFLSKNSLLEVFPNLTIALQLFCTLPVSVASAERSFSKLKLIKTRLRSTMTEQRLSSLAILSIEHELAKTLDFSDVISSFAASKARRAPL